MEPLPPGMIWVCSFAVGDLLKVPLKRQKKNKNESLIAKRGEPYPGGVYFYRISALEIKNKRVELKLAEFDRPKVEKDRRATPEEEWLMAIHTLTVSRNEDLVWLHEFTTGKPTGGVAGPSYSQG